MKHLKKKLVAAVAMLLVAAIALTGASFAWYTLSTNPEVKAIKAQVAANENLEIALDNGYADEDAVDTASVYNSTTAQGSTADNPYTWGNLVDLTTAMTTMNPGAGNGTTTAPELKLAPVEYTDITAGTAIDKSKTVLKYPEYALDGRVKQVTNLLSTENVTDLASISSPDGGVQGLLQKDGTSTVYDALSVIFWMRSNEECEVTLSDKIERAGSDADASAAETDVNGVKGLGSYLYVKAEEENVRYKDASGKFFHDVSGKKTQYTKSDSGVSADYAIIDDYVKNLVIRFDVYQYNSTTKKYEYEKSVFAQYGTGSTVKMKDGKEDTTGTDEYRKYQLTMIDKLNTDSTASSSDSKTVGGKVSIELIRNEAKEIRMYVYVDGKTAKNENALIDDSDLILNVQFSSNEIDGSGEKPGALNGTTK